MKRRLQLAAVGLVGVGLILVWLASRPVPIPNTQPPTPAQTALAAAPTAIVTETAAASATAAATATATQTTTATHTATATATSTSTSTSTASPTNTPAPSAEATITGSTPPTATPYPYLPLTANLTPIPDAARFGSAGGRPDVFAAAAAGLNLGSIFDWNAYANPLVPAGIDFWQMIRVSEQGFNLSFTELTAIISAQPGAIWIIGNEPDVGVQDNTTPETYAERYHQAYTFIKESDPSAQIAIAGVAQPTPLRLAYLDRVLDHYQATYGEPMPIDIWTMHAFILREEAGSWGAGIPPGMTETTGMLYEIADHDNLEIWQTNLLNFRRWLAERGYGNRPVAITEYGILMPTDYGFPPENVIAFLESTVDWMLNTTDPAGYPPENGRLIQWWFWFSVYDRGFPTSDLFDRGTGRLTPLGAAYAALIPQ